LEKLSDPDDIRAWQRLDGRTTTSGKLEDGDVSRLASVGVKHVINLALDTHPEALADEGAKLATHGIGYRHIPVPFDAPDESHFAAFRAALAEIGDAPVHVHCIMNWRVSAFYYRLNRDHLGMDEAAARALMEAQWTPDKSDRVETKVWAEFIQ
jgi:protein tyrosine phosphatase (PTP) superfamily phosphohydrolase (DUF442 family)